MRTGLQQQNGPGSGRARPSPAPSEPIAPRRRRSLQQLHPLGSLASRPITLVTALALPVYATVMTWLNRADINQPVLALLAVTAITVSSVTLIVGSRPLQAPFSRSLYVSTIAAALVAMVLSAASTWTTNLYIRDDWAAPAIGLIMLGLAPYLPARDLVISAIVSSIAAGVLAVAESPWLVTPVPVGVFVVAQVVPLLALGLGAAAFSSSLVRGVERWSEQAATAVTALGDARLDWIARSVQQDRVTILNREVVPYFASLLEAGEITAQSRDEARALSDRIRSLMVAEVDRSWLDGVLEQAARPGGARAPRPVDDPAHLLPALDIDQRTAVRALVGALFAHPEFRPDSLRVRVLPDGERAVVTLVCDVDCSDGRLRATLAPYFAVMRILFADCSVAFESPSLRLRFSYEQ